MFAWVVPKGTHVQRTPDSQSKPVSAVPLGSSVKATIDHSLYPSTFHPPASCHLTIPLPQAVSMFMCRVLLCFGLSLGCGPSGARALALPSMQDSAVDRPEFHRRRHTEKTGPRQPAASPITTIKFVVDYIQLLFGDPTDMRTTRVFFFPPFQYS